MNSVQENIDSIKKICKKYHVKKLLLFGSALTHNFNEDSDFDFVVDFDKQDLYGYADNYFGLKEDLEKILARSIDLLEKQAIKNPYLMKSISKTQNLIYR